MKYRNKHNRIVNVVSFNENTHSIVEENVPKKYRKITGCYFTRQKAEAVLKKRAVKAGWGEVSDATD